MDGCIYLYTFLYVSLRDTTLWYWRPCAMSLLLYQSTVPHPQKIPFHFPVPYWLFNPSIPFSSLCISMLITDVTLLKCISRCYGIDVSGSVNESDFIRRIDYSSASKSLRILPLIKWMWYSFYYIIYINPFCLSIAHTALSSNNTSDVY